MKELFTLGELYVSDFINEESTNIKHELKLILDNNGAVRLEKCAPLDSMYGKYWYRSGINQSMKDDLKEIVESISKVTNIKDGHPVWVDIACNDGTMFDFIPDNVLKIGIDPADDSFLNESKTKADAIIQDYFTFESYRNTNIGRLRADVVTVIAMFYDLDDPNIFLQDINKVMKDDGLLVMQMSYTPLMLKQMAFDNICHEHVYYYSLFNIKSLLEKNGLRIVDCQLNSVNGGSFRVYVKKQGQEHNFHTQPYRDVANFRVNSILEYEKTLGLDKIETWTKFYEGILELKETTIDFIKTAKKLGKTVWGYGASTKGNTLLQFFGLDHTLIDGIAERSPYKWGLKTVGTNIPIYSEDDMRKANPDYLLVLPWHFISEFVKREKDFLINGGKFIVPCPKFEII
jgi:SAM-dependent methyltransferase